MSDIKIVQQEITILDYFAAASLAGLRASKLLNCADGYLQEIWSSKKIAKIAYDDAQAMLKQKQLIDSLKV